MKILQKIKEWKLNRPESQCSKKKLAIAGAALVVAVGLVIGGKILVDHWQFKNYKVITRTELEDTTKRASRLHRVDLPLPDSPTSPRTSPRPMVTLMSWSTWTVRPREKALPPWR